MPPKTKIDREQIVQQALELVRQGGEAALNARSIATALGCSTQPIFSHFHSMQALRETVIVTAGEVYARMVEQEFATGNYPPYKASGMAYIRFAEQEKCLFRLLFMRDRAGEATEDTSLEPLYAYIQEKWGIDRETALLFHLEMWGFVHGIASMLVTGYYTPDWTLIDRMLTDVFTALGWRFGRKE
ncbi:MAG: TetR/AcrR family transcriptional regulator [Clostridia bacterium]|nr:TetR/AcrR family transcriptional regulator [Clostridia bacterium]